MEKSIATMQLRKATLQVFRRIQAFSAAEAISVTYVSCSILLSTFIIVRFSIAADPAVKVVNVALYWGFFFIVPSSAAIWLLLEVSCQKSPQWRVFAILYLLCILFLVVGFVVSPIPMYLLLLLLVPLIVILQDKRKSIAEEPFKRGRAFLLALCLIAAIVLPNVAVFFGVNNVLNRAASMGSEWEKASFISSRVIETTAFGSIPRADTDYWKFLLSGAGRCGEMAIAGTNLMSAAGLEVRRVVLPGEDHAFIEVMIDGVWFVADPGYYGSELLSRAERANRRIAEFGAISYVAAYTESGLVELTQKYVAADTIVIKVTQEGKPLINAQIYLVHKFMGSDRRIPDSDRCFFSNGNGTVVLHLGASTYADKAQPYESQFRIYVNGEDTGYRVESNGTGETQIIKIDLPAR
jgi:hypothetical protein